MTMWTKSQQKGGDIMTNTRLLEEIIDKSGLKRGKIASELELSYSALNKKLIIRLVLKQMRFKSFVKY